MVLPINSTKLMIMDMSETASTVAEQEVQTPAERPAHWFKPGVSGNPAGRIPGSRHKLTTAFVQDLQESWEQYGKEALRRCAVEEPAVYVRTVAMLMPKDVNLSIDVQQFVVRAPTVAIDSDTWQAEVLAPTASSAAIIDLKPEPNVSPVLPDNENEQ